MSAGAFEDGKYEIDSGSYVYPCRVQPETKQLTIGGDANDETSAVITAEMPTLQLRANRRGFGVKPRTVTVELTANGTGATAQYLSGTQHVIPVLQKAVWDAYVKGSTGTYLGIACKVVSKNPELIK